MNAVFFNKKIKQLQSLGRIISIDINMFSYTIHLADKELCYKKRHYNLLRLFSTNEVKND